MSTDAVTSNKVIWVANENADSGYNSDGEIVDPAAKINSVTSESPEVKHHKTSGTKENVWTNKAKIEGTEFHKNENVFTNTSNKTVKMYTNDEGNRVCEIYEKGKLVKSDEFTKDGAIVKAADSKGKFHTSVEATVPDGKGSISFLRGAGDVAKGLAKNVTNLWNDKNGHFSWNQVGESLIVAGAVAGAIAVTAATCGAGAGVGATMIIAAVGVASGGYKAVNGGIKAANAKTDAEADKAWEDVGEGAGTVGLSLLGGKAVMKAGGLSTTETIVENGQSITRGIKTLSPKFAGRLIKSIPQAFTGLGKGSRLNAGTSTIADGAYETLIEGAMKKGTAYKIPKGYKPELTMTDGEVLDFKKPPFSIRGKLANLTNEKTKSGSFEYNNLEISKKDGHIFVKDIATGTSEQIEVANAPKIENAAVAPKKALLEKGQTYEYEHTAGTKTTLHIGRKTKVKVDLENLPKVKNLKEGETTTIGWGDAKRANIFRGVKRRQIIVSKRDGKLYITSNSQNARLFTAETAATTPAKPVAPAVAPVQPTTITPVKANTPVASNEIYTEYDLEQIAEAKKTK